MKKSLFASGFIGAVASLLGVVAVGCSAETGAPDESAQIGSTSEALTASALMFPGFIDIDANKELSLGGYDSSGAGVTTAGIYDASAGTWTTLVQYNNTNTAAPLPTALGETQIIQLATKVYLVTGGRSQLDGTASTFTRILKLDRNANGNLHEVEWITPDQLTVGRAGFGLKKCGSKVAAFAGATNKGMENLSSIGATDTIEVFSYNSGTPASSTWDDLLDSNNDVIKLSTTRAYPVVVSQSDTSFTIMGGINSAILGSTDRLTVDSNCKATTNLDPNTTTAGNPLPDDAVLAQSASIPVTESITTGMTTVTYDALVGGGITSTGNAVTNAAYLYDFSTDAWITAGTLTTARAFPVFVSDGTSPILVDGVADNGSGTLLYNSKKVKQSRDLSTHAWNTEANMTTERVGAFVAYLNGAVHAGMGGKYATGTLTVQNDIE